MKREQLIQAVMDILRNSFKSVKDPELRHWCAAEKIVVKIIEPELKENEKTLLFLHRNGDSQFDC